MAGRKGGGKIATPGKCRSRAFHLAMASVAADCGAADLLVQWPYGVARESRRKPAFQRERRYANIRIESARPGPLTGHHGFRRNAARIDWRR